MSHRTLSIQTLSTRPDFVYVVLVCGMSWCLSAQVKVNAPWRHLPQLPHLPFAHLQNNAIKFQFSIFAFAICNLQYMASALIALANWLQMHFN